MVLVARLVLARPLDELDSVAPPPHRVNMSSLSLSGLFSKNHCTAAKPRHISQEWGGRQLLAAAAKHQSPATSSSASRRQS